MMRLARDIEIAHRRRWPGRPMDWATRAWLLASSPGLQLLLIHRLTHWMRAQQTSAGRAAWLWRILLLALVLPKWLGQVVAKSQIDKKSDIAGGVWLSDQGLIFFGARSTGAGTVIGPRVTVGSRHTDDGHPAIGRNVWIGSDCVVYGAIDIGDGATLLPGTVLTKSIPAGVVMQGNPARMVLRSFDNRVLRERPEVDAARLVDARREA